MPLTDTILKKMSDIFKPQRKFISVLLTTVMLMHGNVSFRNMICYSSLCQKTFSGQFGNPSDSAESDMIGTEMSVTPHTLMIAATDRSLIIESGGTDCHRVFGSQPDYLIDFYHLCEYLSRASESCEPDNPSAFSDRHKQLMKEGKVSEVIDESKPYSESDSVPAAKAPVGCCLRRMNMILK